MAKERNTRPDADAVADAFGGLSYPVAGGASEVVDLRAATQFVVYGASGTPTQQPCDSEGTVLAGTSAANVTRGSVNFRASHYVKITAPASVDCTVQAF